MKNKISKLIAYITLCGVVLSQSMVCFGSELAAEESIEEILNGENGEVYAVQSERPQNVNTENFADDFEAFDKVYSYSNIIRVENNSILTNEQYGDGNLWTMGSNAENAEIVYAVGEDVFMSNIYFEFSRMTDVKYPVISVSADGVEYTDITARMSSAKGDDATVSRDWTKLAAASRENGAQHIYAAEKAVSGVRYLKIEIQANSTVRPMYLRNIAVEVEAVKEVSESITDEYENSDYVYSCKNFEMSSAMELEGLGFKDVTSLQLTDVAKPAEIVYKAKAGKTITEIELGITRWDQIKFPVVSYSYDGVVYTNINQPMTSPSLNDDAYGGFWAHQGNAGFEYREMYRFKQALPEGATYVKIWLGGGYVVRNDKFFMRNAILNVESAGIISDDVYSEAFETLDFASVCENIEQTENGFIAMSGGKLGYRAVSGKRIKTFSVAYEGDSLTLNLNVYDAKGRVIPFSVAEDGELSDGILYAELPLNAKSVVMENADSVLYTAIDIELDTAEGYAWLLAEEKTVFEISDGNMLSAKTYVSSQAGEDIPVTAILVVYEGADIVKIVSQRIDAKAGKKTELYVETIIPESDEKISAELNVISDIKNGISIGNTAVYSE
ncbi:MAG: hypothetical protein IJN96_06560 [Clostridia bacterium]|nr:hypothetical protein [Clostridia bacterium]